MTDAPAMKAGERPVRVRLSRVKGWRMPENTVKVDRSTGWGNHFRVLACEDGAFEIRRALDEPNLPEARAATRDEALAVTANLFREWLQGEFGAHFRRRARADLRGKNLACWCPLDQPCHADVLLEIANVPLPPASAEESR